MVNTSVDLDLIGDCDGLANDTLLDTTEMLDRSIDLTQRVEELHATDAPLANLGGHEEHLRNMELKIVLATAYIENGFIEEAHALLQDVRVNGSERQQAQAMRLLRDGRAGAGMTKRAS